MEIKMMMPASYNVLSNEEMTYTEGGATATLGETLAVWLWPSYAEVIAVNMCREERQNGNSDWLAGAWDKMKEKGGWYAAGMAIHNGLDTILSVGTYALIAMGIVCF